MDAPATLAWAKVAQLPLSRALPAGASCKRQPMSWASLICACKLVSVPSVMGALLVPAHAKAPCQASWGAWLSVGSWMRRLWLWVLLKPSRSVAVTRMSARPGWPATSLNRPEASSATSCQVALSPICAGAWRICTRKLAIPLQASARTATTTV